MLFSYRAKTKNGETTEGTIEAVDRFVATRELKSKGQFPISINVKKSDLGTIQVLSFIDNIFSGVNISDQIIITKNLSKMLQAGLSLSRALSVIEKQTKKVALSKIIISLKKGSFSSASFIWSLIH